MELKAIDPPHSIQDSMEKQMRAERDRRAAILNAEGFKQSQILTAEGEKQSQILRAEGEAQAAVLKAQGEARAIQQVFDAIHRGKPTQRLLAYQYLQTLPQLAQGDSNKMWVIPSEVTDALRGISSALGGDAGRPGDNDDEEWVDPGTNDDNAFADTKLEDPQVALANARGQVDQATNEAEDSTSRPQHPSGADDGVPALGASAMPQAPRGAQTRPASGSDAGLQPEPVDAPRETQQQPQRQIRLPHRPEQDGEQPTGHA